MGPWCLVLTMHVLYVTEMQGEVGHPGYHGGERVARQPAGSAPRQGEGQGGLGRHLPPR